LQRGLTLRGKDRETYARFSADKSQPELVAAITRALGMVVTTRQADDLQRVAHSIVLNPHTPFPAPKFHAPSPQTLPPRFAQSVLEAESGRRPSRPASPASSPTTPPAALPQVQSAGSSGKRGLRGMFKLPGARHGTSSASTSNPSSAASSVNSPPAGSRASSPSRGSGDSSPHTPQHRILLPSLSPGVGFEDETRPKTHRGSFSAHISALLSRDHTSAPPSNETFVKPPLGMLYTPRSRSEHDDDDEGLLGISLAEGAMDLSPTAQVKVVKKHAPPGIHKLRRTFSLGRPRFVDTFILSPPYFTNTLKLFPPNFNHAIEKTYTRYYYRFN
jgi:hypothetical protein